MLWFVENARPAEGIRLTAEAVETDDEDTACKAQPEEEPVVVEATVAAANE